MKEDAEGVDAHHVIESVAVVSGLEDGGRESREHADEGDYAERLLRVVCGDERIHQHDQNAEDGEHQLREDPDVVDGRNHRPITCKRAWVTSEAVEAEACTPPKNCFRANETEGSIECSQRFGATPMTSAA